MGLSISKAIIEKMGGTIHFKSAPPRGTTFYFDLPIWQEALRSNKTKIQHEKIPTVLICEDDKDTAHFLKVTLEANEVNTIVTNTASEAKHILMSNKIDALILDLILPDRNGILLIEELRKTPKTAKLPIIVVSIRAEEGKLELSSSALTMIDWINKPVDLERLKNSIDFIKSNLSSAAPSILYVEDDISLSHVVLNLLEDKVNIITVSTIEAAKDELLKDKYDLVILDLLLPDGSGLDLIPELSKQQIPVVVFSAYELPNDYVDKVAAALVKSKTTNDELLRVIKNAIKPKTKEKV